MTHYEFVSFFEECSICFPDFAKWVRENSPDAPRTLAKWSPILSGVSTAEAASVLDRWVRGVLPSPKPYERENFILLVKSVVDNDRAKLNRQYDSEENRARFEKSKGYKQTPVMARMSEAFTLMRAEYDKVTSGQQSQIEADLAVAEIQRDFEKRVDLNHSIPSRKTGLWLAGSSID